MGKSSTKKQSNKLTVPVITKRLDELLKVVRYYGTKDGVTNRCATCGKPFIIKELQCGHFIKRGNLFLKYTSMNLMPQCRRCNHFLDGAQDKAAYYIVNKHGVAEFKWLVETDFKWLAGKLSRPNRQELVWYYNYWLAENRRIEDDWGVKLIPVSWEPTK